MSLRRRLLLALLGAVLSAGLAASAATYLAARNEVQALLDEELREVAASLREHAVLDLAPLVSAAPDGARRVVVQIWDRYGFVSYRSNTHTALPAPREEGFSTIRHEGREWRMYTERIGPRLVQAAQTTADRTRLAAAAAFRVLVPVLAALPFLGLLVWIILERGFAPFERLTGAVRARGASALEPLPTERVPLEVLPLVHALNNLLDRLRQALELQRRFAADAAHELRTPLTALGLQIQLLERARDEHERAAGIAGLKERAKRAERIVQQLLVMARLDPEAAREPAEAVPLHELARSVVDDLAPIAAQNGFTLVLTRAEPAAVLGSEEALRLLATNLVDNAIRYGGAGGRAEVAAWREGGSSIFQVCDNGPGIPPEDRERVFDRFYRGADMKATGSGLGLAIVRRVAELHLGRVELAQGLDRGGLCARFVAPAAPESAELRFRP